MGSSTRRFAKSYRIRAASPWLVLVSLVSCGCTKDASDAGDDLTGTWDVIGTSPSGARAELAIKLDASRIEIIGAGGAFSAVPAKSGFALTYSASDRSAEVQVVRTDGGSMKFGVIPLDLSGLWSFRTPDFKNGVGCNVTFEHFDLSGTCAQVALPIWVDPYRIANGTASGSRSPTASSIFGDLGGKWTVTSSDGAACTFDFHDDKFQSRCNTFQNGNDRDLGGVDITFSRDTASGTTTRGIEFSAHRR